MDPEEVLINERKNKLKELRNLKIDPYPYKYSPTHNAGQLQNSFSGLKSVSSVRVNDMPLP